MAEMLRCRMPKKILRAATPPNPEPQPMRSENEEECGRLNLVIQSPQTSADELGEAWSQCEERGDYQLAYDAHRRLLAACETEYERNFVYLAYHAEAFQRLAALGAAESEPEVGIQLLAEAMELLGHAIAVGLREWQRCPVPPDDKPDAPIRLMFEIHVFLSEVQRVLGFPQEVLTETQLQGVAWAQLGSRPHD